MGHADELATNSRCRTLPRPSMKTWAAGREGWALAMNLAEPSWLLRHRFTKKRFYDYYIKGGFEKLKPALKDEDIDLYCLDLIASGLCSIEEAIKNFLLSTYTGVSCWSGVAGDDLRKPLPSASKRSSINA